MVSAVFRDGDCRGQIGGLFRRHPVWGESPALTGETVLLDQCGHHEAIDHIHLEIGEGVDLHNGLRNFLREVVGKSPLRFGRAPGSELLRPNGRHALAVRPLNSYASRSGRHQQRFIARRLKPDPRAAAASFPNAALARPGTVSRPIATRLRR